MWVGLFYGSATNSFAVPNDWSHFTLVVTLTLARVYLCGKEAIINGAIHL